VCVWERVRRERESVWERVRRERECVGESQERESVCERAGILGRGASLAVLSPVLALPVPDAVKDEKDLILA